MEHYFKNADGDECLFIHDGDVPPSNLVWDCPMIWTLPEDTGRRVADMDPAPARDNKGPRAGKGWKGRIKG